MKQIALLVALLIAPLMAVPVMAQDTMTAEEFDAYALGRTFTYGSNGAPYGAEEYLENRRVRCSFLDGQCKEGEWYEQDDLICFTYEDNPTPQCWSFIKDPKWLIARFENDPAQSDLYEVDQSGEPMLCLGPKIGV